MEAEEPGSLQDILQQKLGNRRMAGGCLCSGAKCRPRVRQARSPPGAGENDKRPRHPKNEVCVTAARCPLPGAGAKETLAELVGLLQPRILAVSPPKQWEAAPPPLGLPSRSPPCFLWILSEQPGPVLPGRRRASTLVQTVNTRRPELQSWRCSHSPRPGHSHRFHMASEHLRCGWCIRGTEFSFLFSLN